MGETIEGNIDLLLFYGPTLSLLLIGVVTAIMSRRGIYCMSDIQSDTPRTKITHKQKRMLSNITCSDR